MTSKAGSFGNYQVGIRVSGSGDSAETISAEVGSIIVATGFDSYLPGEGEFGAGMPGVVTLPEFKDMVDGATGPLRYRGRPVRSLAYVYCVGSRGDGGNAYCSRFCCSATAHVSIRVSGLDPKIRQYHLYRDIRTYGTFELMYTESRKKGAVYVKYPDDAPPVVATEGNGPQGHRPGPSLRRRGSRDPGRPRGPGHGHGRTEERRADRSAQAPDRQRTASSTRSTPSCGRSRPSSTAS